MADTVSSQVILNNPRHLVMLFTNKSDGTGENNVVKVDATSTDYGVNVAGQVTVPGIYLKVKRIRYDVGGMKVAIAWKANTNIPIWYCTGFGKQVFEKAGGIEIPRTAGAVPTGATGEITFTTIGAASNATYSIWLEMTKGVPQS